jgi:AraC-like DNA-binding protein
MLIVIDDGGLHIVDGQPYPLHRGDVHLLGPSSIHHGVPVADEVTNYYNIEFSPEVLCFSAHDAIDWRRQLILREFFLPRPFAPITVTDSVLPDLHALCQVLERHMDEQSALATHCRSLLLTSLLYMLAPCIPDIESAETSTLFTVMDIINSRFREELTNLELAHAARVSPPRLAQICKSTTGKTVKDLLVQRRLTEAKLLLTETSLSVMEVMMESGFNDLSYFHRVFKQDTGHSPKEFRAQSSP